MTAFDFLQAPSDAKQRIGMAWLLLLAVASIALWRIAEHVTLRLVPDSVLMLRSASVMLRASEVIRNEKAARGLLRGRDLDPNQTGLIGPEWSETMTTVGSLQAKRTLTIYARSRADRSDNARRLLAGARIAPTPFVRTASYSGRPLNLNPAPALASLWRTVRGLDSNHCRLEPLEPLADAARFSDASSLRVPSGREYP